jgi:hypothetical protein
VWWITGSDPQNGSRAQSLHIGLLGANDASTASRSTSDMIKISLTVELPGNEEVSFGKKKVVFPQEA